VFDTETTGLNPSQGDEIIQIGAARIVNGKLLRQECFEQLVDPKRPIPPATIPSTASRPRWCRASPTSGGAAGLPRLCAGHGAGGAQRGVRHAVPAAQGKSHRLAFDQPVLDTLLLSAVVHPNQDSHRLEAIAERFNVTVIGRHTAMGDAMVTAEVFLKLIPLLAEKGIHTLGQARDGGAADLLRAPQVLRRGAFSGPWGSGWPARLAGFSPR
jgi:DNA polymerase III subunit epsilon